MTNREKQLEAALQGMLTAVTWGGANVGDQAKIELAYDSPEIKAARAALARND